jgi:hypothetical protein
MINHTVQLQDGTVGEVRESASGHFLSLGDLVAVSLHDENGMPIVVFGRIAFFLDEEEI